MSVERNALIATIRAAPDEDGPRLVFADWLEEQGDAASTARAEFIRTQIERANLPSGDDRHPELQARELRLLKRWSAAWCSSHSVFKKVRFRRGMIEYVHLHLQHFLHHRRQMFALEPVRDVRLTGFYRATDDLVRRVAQCEEWKHIETLRIHHQGPHHDPRSNLVILLESPHLTRLRSLHTTQVQFNADARRRFERLALLRQLHDLHFPTLDMLMHHPGDWFSDGETELAADSVQLRSLVMPYYLRLEMLRQLSAMPFWNRLTSIQLQLPGHRTPDVLSLLRERMPPTLKSVRLAAGISPDDYSGAESFFERLARAPIQILHLHDVPVAADTLRRLLDGTNRWNLKDLRLMIGTAITEEHLRIIANSPGVKNLQSLNLSGGFNVGSAQALFSSDQLHSLTHLGLSGIRVGTAATIASASATGWDRLRSLALSYTGLEADGLRSIVRSRLGQQLVWLSMDAHGFQDFPALELSPELAEEISRLPNLACLRLGVTGCDLVSRRTLTESDTLAWPLIEDDNDPSIKNYRANRAPERFPPLDDAMEVFSDR